MEHASEAASKLRQAVEAERLSSVHTTEFSNLLEKMASFYEGKGPAPEMKDFLAWQNSVTTRKTERHSGMGDLPSP